MKNKILTRNRMALAGLGIAAAMVGAGLYTGLNSPRSYQDHPSVVACQIAKFNEITTRNEAARITESEKEAMPYTDQTMPKEIQVARQSIREISDKLTREADNYREEYRKLKTSPGVIGYLSSDERCILVGSSLTVAGMGLGIGSRLLWRSKRTTMSSLGL